MSENATEKPPEKAVVKHGGEKTTGGALQRLVPQNFGELERLATILCKSDIVPKDLQGKAANVLLVLMYGNEIGITPAQALQNVMVVNGRPSLWGDATMGLCIASEVYEDSKDSFDETTMTATFRAKRKGKDWVVRTFSQKDAEKAKLWTKQGPWQEYPKRMLFHRARSWALRDTFPDVLKGIRYFEEERDFVETTAERVYDMPKENAAPPAAPAPQAPTAAAPAPTPAPEPAPENKGGEAVAFNVYSAATTDFNGNTDCYVIKDTTEPPVKYYTDQESHFTMAKAAKASGARVAAIYVEKDGGKNKVRWLLSLQAKQE
jgi:hypothetical protein